ncbi:MAG: aminotransferase class V-fold PLP-dependent enzyme [Deltaproteobacteria bacterium]|nr:aminotransferase class V-fold PLP-dependent enzyme [Deltaproteobacteria bacterium]
MNNASCSWPLPEDVATAIKRSIDSPPLFFNRATGGADTRDEIRKTLAEILHCEKDEISLVSGATAGLNVAILGLKLKKGDTIVTTDAEHNSVYRPLQKFLEFNPDNNLVNISCNHEGVPSFDEFKKFTESKDGSSFKVLVMSSLSNVTGRYTGWKEFFKLAKSRGVTTLLDASQSFGKTQTGVDEYIHADIVVAPSHKGIRSLQGLGFLKIFSTIQIRQIISGGTGTESYSLTHPKIMPEKFEAGTPHYTGSIAMLKALMWGKENSNIFSSR